MALIDPPWRQRQGYAELIAALGADEARVVGGAVRDALLGRAADDLDIATVHAPPEVVRRLAAAGIRTVPTGLAHGTVTALLPSGPVEVTTLRRDVATDGRHAVVAYTGSWREDAARRDFTINALYADGRDNRVHDYFDGMADLAQRRVRFIGDPLQRIAEDHLRILRFFRFHARFGVEIDEAGLAACADRANDLMALSRERIRDELLKLLLAPGAVEVMRLMVTHGIWRPVLPEIYDTGIDGLAALADREAAAAIAPDPVRRLAALVPPASAEEVGARLKLSNADRKRLVASTLGLGTEGPHALAYRAGTAGAIDRLLLAGADPGAIVGWQPPRLPITGGALVERGVRKGPAVAAALRRIEDQWVAEGFPPQARVDAIADMIAAGAIVAQAADASSGRA